MLCIDMYCQWETNFHAVERWGYVGVHRMISWLRQVDWLLLSLSLSLRVMLMRFSFMAIKTRVLVGIYMVLFGHFTTVFRLTHGQLFRTKSLKSSQHPGHCLRFSQLQGAIFVWRRGICAFPGFSWLLFCQHGFNLVSIFFEVIHLAYTNMIRLDPNARSF